MAQVFGFDGREVKNLDLPQYPDDAWDWYSGEPGVEVDQGLYQKVAFVYRCVQLVASAVEQMPFALVAKASGDDYDVSSDWKNKVGYLPDPATLFAQVQAAISVWGTAYLFKTRNRARLLDLRYIVPTTITPKLDAADGLMGFTRTLSTGQQNLEPDDLVYFWQFDPWVELGPPQSSAFRAAMTAAGLLYALDVYEAEFVRRGGVLPTMLMVKGMPALAEREKLESYWDKFIKGFFKVSGKIFNAEAFDVKTVGEGLSNVKDSNFTQLQRENIAAAFGVPLSMLMSNASNYATAVSDRRVFWENAIIPACEFIADILNEQLFDAQGLRLEWRYETMDAFQTDEQARAVAYATYIQAGMLPSVAAQVVGIELPPGMEYSALDHEAAEEAEEQPEPPTDHVQRAMSEARQEAREDDEPEPPAMLSLSSEALRDLDAWQRKATKLHKRGEALTFQFESTHIPAPITARIARGLGAAKNADDIRATFAGAQAQQPGDIEALLEAIRLGVEAMKAQSYKPPQAVRDAARRGLELREKHGRGGLTTQEAGEQGIGSGVARAANLANGDNISIETMRRMRAFFSRHEKNKSGGEDDAGYIAWLLWGGDPGRAWVERVLDEIEREE